MEYVRITKENLEKEHICCAISNNKDVQVSSKKLWLRERLDEGTGQMLHRVYSGRKGMGADKSRRLYVYRLSVGVRFFQRERIFHRPFGPLHRRQHAKREKGPLHSFVCEKEALSFRPRISFAYRPSFKDCAKHPHVEEKGYILYYTNQCPFTAKYVPIIESIAKEHHIPFRSVHIENRDMAQSAPTPVTTYALFLDGEYLTNEILSDKKFLKMLQEQSTLQKIGT